MVFLAFSLSLFLSLISLSLSLSFDLTISFFLLFILYSNPDLSSFLSQSHRVERTSGECWGDRGGYVRREPGSVILGGSREENALIFAMELKYFFIIS